MEKKKFEMCVVKKFEMRIVGYCPKHSVMFVQFRSPGCVWCQEMLKCSEVFELFMEFFPYIILSWLLSDNNNLYDYIYKYGEKPGKDTYIFEGTLTV